MSRELFDLGGGHIGDLRPLSRLFGRWLPVLDMRKTVFLACWLEFHELFPPWRDPNVQWAAYSTELDGNVRPWYDRANDDWSIWGWMRRMYATPDRVHAISMCASPFLRALQKAQPS